MMVDIKDFQPLPLLDETGASVDGDHIPKQHHQDVGAREGKRPDSCDGSTTSS